MECMGPEFDIEVGTQEWGANGVSKSSVSALDRTILSRRVCTSGMCCTAFLLEQVANLGMIEEFSALVEMHTFIAAARIVLREEMCEPLQWRTF